jgi:hypothetical protein
MGQEIKLSLRSKAVVNVLVNWRVYAVSAGPELPVNLLRAAPDS